MAATPEPGVRSQHNDGEKAEFSSLAQKGLLPGAESRAVQDRWVSFSVCEHFCACMCVILRWGKWPLKPCCLGDQQQIETSGISGPQLDAPCQTRTQFVRVV